MNSNAPPLPLRDAVVNLNRPAAPPTRLFVTVLVVDLGLSVHIVVMGTDMLAAGLVVHMEAVIALVPEGHPTAADLVVTTGERDNWIFLATTRAAAASPAAVDVDLFPENHVPLPTSKCAISFHSKVARLYQGKSAQQQQVNNAAPFHNNNASQCQDK